MTALASKERHDEDPWAGVGSAAISYGLAVGVIAFLVGALIAKVLVRSEGLELVASAVALGAGGVVLGASDALQGFVRSWRRTLTVLGCMASVLAGTTALLSLVAIVQRGELPWHSSRLGSDAGEIFWAAVFGGLLLAPGRLAAGPDGPGVDPLTRVLRGCGGTALSLVPGFLFILVAVGGRAHVDRELPWIVVALFLPNGTLAVGPVARRIEQRLFSIEEARP